MSIDSTKKYALVKWLENSQFDVNNEWYGRITSVSHTNIIDIDTEELKTGMEISIFRNGEMWRAQVIIPKTNMSAVDLAPSSHKIRTIVLPVGKQTFQEITEYDGENSESAKITDEQQQDSRASVSLALTAAVTSTAANTILQACNNNMSADSCMKQWNFIQTALNESCLHDLYASQQQVNSVNSNKSVNMSSGETTAVNDLNIEAIMSMQHELITQQRELKDIEVQTMQQIKQLHSNVSRLNRKFDEFIRNLSSMSNPTLVVERAKYSLHNMNNTIQQYCTNKLTHDESLLNSDQSPVNTAESSSIMETMPTTPITTTASSNSSSSSLSSPSLITLTPVKPTDSELLLQQQQHYEHDLIDSEKIKQKRNQILINKFLRDSVKQRLGEEFLINNRISEIPAAVINEIKKAAFEKFTPECNQTKKSWNLAIASLRVLKRDLTKSHTKNH